MIETYLKIHMNEKLCQLNADSKMSPAVCKD